MEETSKPKPQEAAAAAPAKPAQPAQPPKAEQAKNAAEPKPASPPQPKPAPSFAPAPPARPRRRHWGILIGFLLFVVLPTTIVTWYLETRAQDQFASRSGFAVRSEETTSAGAIEFLGGLSSGLGGGSASSDTDILYEYLQSQELVEALDNALDLRAIYSKALPIDPVFGFEPDQPIEDLVAYWKRVVRVSYDGGTGLIELRVLAFDAADAKRINEAIFEKSTAKINELSAIAREDATRYAREELNKAVARLKEARAAITRFRNQTHIIDPETDLQVLLGVQSTLQQQLANALIEADTLRQTSRPGDPRLEQAELRIEVIEERITREREKFGTELGGDETQSYSVLVGEYERLTVDLEFAERAYVSALSAYDVALAEAQRKSRYLAAYIKPTLAQSAQYPERLILIGLSALFLLLGWAILTLIYYSVRDRR